MTARDVLDGQAQWSCECTDCLPWLTSLPARSVSLVLFSPPYSDARTYGIGFKLRGQAWVDWMRPIIAESCRVSSGLVIVNASAPVKKHKYTPAVEWLVADLTRLDGLVWPGALRLDAERDAGKRQQAQRVSPALLGTALLFRAT